MLRAASLGKKQYQSNKRGDLSMMISGKSDVGCIRQNNEDTFVSGTLANGTAFAVVCDGMGGANGGQTASTLAAETIQKRLELSGNNKLDSRSIRNLLLCACEAANSAVFEKAQNEPELQGMGTTVVAAIINGKTAYVLHVGDSRAYFTDGDELIQITRDHSMVQELYESGEISKEEANVHPRKNIITKAVGVFETLSYDYNEVQMKSGAKLLLCTDGLTNMISDEEIHSIINENSAEKLVDAAVKAGGSDNVTAVLIYDI